MLKVNGHQIWSPVTGHGQWKVTLLVTEWLVLQVVTNYLQRAAISAAVDAMIYQKLGLKNHPAAYESKTEKMEILRCK